MEYKAETIVLDSKECREYDRIYTILSREKGKMSLIGVGTRKPKAKLASGMEPLTKNEVFLIKCRGLDRLKGVLIHEQYREIKNNYDKTILVRRTTSLLKQLLPEEESCEKIFLALEDFLNLVEKTSFADASSGRNKVLMFQMNLFWQVIAHLGITPSLYNCVNCRKKITSSEKLLFSVPNGLTCNSCKLNHKDNNLYISVDAVKILRVFLSGKNEILTKIKIEPKVLREITNVTRYVLAYVTERKIIF